VVKRDGEEAVGKKAGVRLEGGRRSGVRTVASVVVATGGVSEHKNEMVD